MSYRERRNRKDAKGKTPGQIRRGQRGHEVRYERTIAETAEGLREGDFPLTAAGYLRAMRLHLDHWTI